MTRFTVFILTTGIFAAPVTWLTPTASAADVPAAASASLAAQQDPAAQAQALIDKGLAYLKAQQKPDGGWQTDKEFPAMTAIVLRAFVESGGKYDANTDFVKKGYDKLFSYQ